MLKNNKGSVAIMAFVVMLFISLYGAIVLGNSSRKYQNQTNSINAIISSYAFQGGDTSSNGKMVTQQELENLYYKIGGEKIEIIRH